MNFPFTRYFCLTAAITAIVISTTGMLTLTSAQENSKDPKPKSKASEASTPNPAAAVAKALALLQADEGTWEAEVSLWLRPGAEPVKSLAVVNASMMLDGKYFQQRFEGKFGPELGNRPWSTVSQTGFNATTLEYETVRMSSTTSTMIVVRGKGTSDSDKGYSMEQNGEYVLMGAKATERDVTRHEGPDKCIIESYMSFGGAAEFKGSEMVLTRIKQSPKSETQKLQGESAMQLGNFSISLSVKDLKASLAFYEKLGFKAIGGNGKQFLILQNDASTIGLFQGMFEKNTLTYNPGWDRNSATLPKFDDVREIQKMLKERGIVPTMLADEATSGPASLMVIDPDGNPILIDQHVPKP